MTKGELARKLQAVYLNTPAHEDGIYERADWLAVVEVAAQALGVELAPERPPAESGRSGWFALVAAYEAARKAGVLPGLEGPAPGKAAENWFGWVPLRVADDGLVWTDEEEAQGLIDLHRFGVGLANRKLLVESYSRWLAAKRLLEENAAHASSPLPEIRTLREAATGALRILRGEDRA